MNFIMAVDLNAIFVWVNVMNDDILFKDMTYFPHYISQSSTT